MAVTRIAMWSGPRTISTAMMRAWENRPDTTVVDEPLYAAYLATTGIEHPGREEVLAAQPAEWRAAVAELVHGDVPTPIHYQKHMTHHMTPDVELGPFEPLTHAFLIRDPTRLVASYARVRSAPTPADLGLDRQLELFVRFGGPVVDADDVLRDPRGMLTALCAALGVPWDERMLSWPAGRRDSDGVWAPHWYAAVERSTGFGPPAAGAPEIPPRLEPVRDACRGPYATMAAHRLRPGD
jgi:hypothetical protein